MFLEIPGIWGSASIITWPNKATIQMLNFFWKVLSTENMFQHDVQPLMGNFSRSNYQMEFGFQYAYWREIPLKRRE
jgi:hypothetical protein